MVKKILISIIQFINPFKNPFMKTNSKKNKIIPFLSVACFAFLILSMQIGCKHIPPHWESYISIDSNFQHIPADTNQLIVWRTPNSDPGYLNTWLDSINTYCGPIQIKVFCLSCDSSLMLLTGQGVTTYIQGNGGSHGGTSGCTSNCPPSGGGDTIYWCRNVSVDMNDSSVITLKNKTFLPSTATAPGTDITVAVFDTGVDSLELSNSGYLYKGNIPSCLNTAATNGWNFPDSSPAVTDDYMCGLESPEHGAIVSKLIVEQVRHYAENNVKILPVKIHNCNGQSDLFSVLCGFAYAKERGAQIINASFGYYEPKKYSSVNGSVLKDPSVFLLKRYIQYYLTNNNILLITAAGNKKDAQETQVFTSAGLTPPTDLRNLDSVYFYPASLAADPEMTNIISVTTVDTISNTVSPLQNYSPNVVDIGVNADDISGEDYYFVNPRVDSGLSEGSSFATPIVTGIICSHYSLIRAKLAGQAFNKQNILNILLQPGAGIGLNINTTQLGQKIKTGIFLNKALPYRHSPL